MTKVEWHPMRTVETEDGTIKWEGNTPAPDETVLITYSDGEVGIDTFFQDSEGDSYITFADDVIAWAELPEPYKKPEPLDMHPDAIAARRYMENSK